MEKKSSFQKFFDSLTAEEKQVLAQKAATSVPYLNQIYNETRRAGANIISRLMAADKRITFQMMRE